MAVADSGSFYGSDNGSGSIYYTTTTVYIGQLHEETTEPLLCALFSQFGTVKKCKIIPDGTISGDKYAFIEYGERKEAEMAINTMTGRVFLGKTIKVNWGVSPTRHGTTTRSNQSHHPIFVGDISSDVTETQLQDVFAKFGTISECRIIRDPLTLKCKNYGFITFETREAAENAIKLMNGYWIGNRSIRTNWAGKKMMPSNQTMFHNSSDKQTYQQIQSDTSPKNSTIYCGNVTKDLSESLLNDMFSRFGAISSIRVFPGKGFGFVNFCEKSSAVNAILQMNGNSISGDTIKVSWGRERGRESAMMYDGGGPQSHAAYYAQQYQNTVAMFMQQQSFYAPPFPADSAYLSQGQGQYFPYTQTYPFSNAVTPTNQLP